MPPLLDNAVLAYFDDAENVKQLSEIVKDKNMQPRLLDYYITQYAKESPIFYKAKHGVHDVYSSYKLQLKAYHKRGFNLFEKNRSTVPLTVGTKKMQYTVPQLNVYRWLIKSGVIGLLKGNIENVHASYQSWRRLSIRKKKHAGRKKRGKSRTFMKYPILIRGINKSESTHKKKCTPE